MAKRRANAKKKAGNVSPTCSCLVLCDDVVISHGRDKHRLEGIIGAITVPWVPHPAPGGVVYVRLSNVHRTQTVKVLLVRADDHEALWEIEAQVINQNEPLDVHTLVAKVPTFLVQQEGRYLLEARHNGVPIASVPIRIRAAMSGPPGERPRSGTDER